MIVHFTTQQGRLLLRPWAARRCTQEQLRFKVLTAKARCHAKVCKKRPGLAPTLIHAAQRLLGS